MDNVLVIQLARMGDFLQTTPLLQGLKQHAGTSTVTVVVDKRNCDIAAWCPAVDRVIGFDDEALGAALCEEHDSAKRFALVREACRDLDKAQVDTVITLNYSPRAMLLASLVSCANSLGYTICRRSRSMHKSPWFAFFNAMLRRATCAPFNLADYFYRLCLGDGYQGGRLSLRVPAAETPPAMANITRDRPMPGAGCLIALQVATRDVRRQWSAEQFAVLADMLLKNRQVSVVLLGAPADLHQGEAVLACMQANRCPDVHRVDNRIGTTSLADLARILAAAQLMITADTGAMHLAAAVGCPVLALFFASAYAGHTAPYGAGHCIVQSRVSCFPCTPAEQGACRTECRTAIRPAAVYAHAQKMLPEALAGSPEDDHDNDVLHTAFDRFGVTLRPHNGCLSDDMLRSRVYRHMGMELLGMLGKSPQEWSNAHTDPPDMPRPPDADAFISRAAASGQMVLNRYCAAPAALHECRLDARAQFWHPWLDFHDEMTRFCPGLTPGLQQHLFARGMQAGLTMLRRASRELHG